MTLLKDLQDTLETELLQKRKILLLRETTAIDPGRDHVEVVRRAEVLRVGRRFTAMEACIDVHGVHGDRSGYRERRWSWVD